MVLSRSGRREVRFCNETSRFGAFGGGIVVVSEALPDDDGGLLAELEEAFSVMG